MQIEWQGRTFELCADKAIYWPDESCLFVADLHFGKAASFRSVGIPVPEQTTLENCQRLTTLLCQTGAQNLVVLGDFLHARAGKTDVVKGALVRWREQHHELQIHLVRGNHDLGAGDPWPQLAINCVAEPWEFRGLCCRHEPIEDAVAHLAGHIHPAASVARMRVPCFWIRPRQIVLPAFGSFTGTHVVEPEAADELYGTDGETIMRIPH
jgi:uncharacterized protein